MNLNATEDSASRFAVYLGELTSVIGHADREQPLNDYCAGLMVAEGRRSVEPIAAVTAPRRLRRSIKDCCTLLPTPRGPTRQ